MSSAGGVAGSGAAAAAACVRPGGGRSSMASRPALCLPLLMLMLMLAAPEHLHAQGNNLTSTLHLYSTSVFSCFDHRSRISKQLKINH